MLPRVVSRLLSFGARRTLPARDAYALWADTYPPLPHNPLMQVEQAVVTSMIAAISPLRALDVGTGSGRYLPLLASTGARVVVGVDFSMPMLKMKFGASDVRLKPDATRDATRVCGDACRLPFQSASFDLVSSSLMAGDVADLAGWIGELARVLAPGGHLVYSDFHPDWAARGWRRTFTTADGRSFEVPYFPHAIADHLALLAERSFDVRTIREPRLAPPDAVVRPGRSRRRDVPVVVAFHAVKRRCAVTRG